MDLNQASTITLDGYTAEHHWDEDAQRFVARIIDIDAVIHFEAEDEQELLEEMRDSIASYKEFLEDLAEYNDEE